MNFIHACSVVLLIIWSTDAATTDADQRGIRTETIQNDSNYLYDTDIAIKQGIHDYKNSIKIEARDFEDLVKNSKVFVDQTMLIYGMLNKTQQSPVILWLAPDGWGKTTNLNMLKTFYEMPVDNHGNPLPVESTFAFRLFVKGEIPMEDGRVDKLTKGLALTKQEHFMVKNLARFPVIYASFKEAVRGYVNVREKVIHQIRLAFKHHAYMVHVLNDACHVASSNSCNELKEFKDFLYGATYCKEDTDKLAFLSDVLYKHFKIKPIILLDDYDAPVRNIIERGPLSVREHYRYYELVESLVRKTFKYGTYHKAYLTGIFDIKLDNLVSEVQSCYVAEDYEPMNEYFGFHSIIVQRLFEIHGISEYLSKEAFKWYGGRKTTRDFCQSSTIAKFLQEQDIEVYFENNRSDEFVTNVLRKQLTLRGVVLRVLSNKTETFSRRRVFADEHRNDTRGFIHDKDAFLSCLVANGYLQITSEQRAIVPNIEASIVLHNVLISGYKQEYKINEEILGDAAYYFYEYMILKYNTTKNTEWQNALTSLYQNTSNVDNLSDVISVFNCISLKMAVQRVRDVNVYYDKSQKADIVVVDIEKFLAAVIELTYDRTVEEAFELADRHFSIRRLVSMNMIKYIGINVASDKTVEVFSLLKHVKLCKLSGITTEETLNDMLDRLQEEENEFYGF